MPAATPGADPLLDCAAASVTLRFREGLLDWNWLVAVLGYLEHVRLNRQASAQVSDRPGSPHRATAVRAYLSGMERHTREAVLPFYGLRQTVIVTAGYHVVQWRAGAPAKFAAISPGSLAITLPVYETVISHVAPVCFLFGMKLPPTGRRRQPQPEPSDRFSVDAPMLNEA